MPAALYKPTWFAIYADVTCGLRPSNAFLSNPTFSGGTSVVHSALSGSPSIPDSYSSAKRRCTNSSRGTKWSLWRSAAWTRR
jgi:hypothetical protein